MPDTTNPFAKCETVSEVVGTYGGAVSMCWDPPPRTQVFDSAKAGAFTEAAMARLEELWSPGPTELSEAADRLWAELRVRTHHAEYPTGLISAWPPFDDATYRADLTTVLQAARAWHLRPTGTPAGQT